MTATKSSTSRMPTINRPLSRKRVPESPSIFMRMVALLIRTQGELADTPVRLSFADCEAAGDLGYPFYKVFSTPPRRSPPILRGRALNGKEKSSKIRAQRWHEEMLQTRKCGICWNGWAQPTVEASAGFYPGCTNHGWTASWKLPGHWIPNGPRISNANGESGRDLEYRL